MRNSEVAAKLYELADFMEMMGIEWKPLALRKAAKNIEGFPESVEGLARAKGAKGLQDISGVGEGISKKVVEFLETGKMQELESIKKKIPSGVLSLMRVQGLGPKKAWKLYTKLKIDSIEKLEKMARTGKIRQLEGFGEKSEEDILMGLEFYKKGQERMLLGIVLPLAMELEAKVKALPFVEKAVVCGSIRRRRETVKDIDILVLSKKPVEVIDSFASLSDVARVLAKGDTKCSVVLHAGLNCDVRVLEEKSLGAAMNYFTGSKEHNVALREIAVKKGWKLSEYGLFDAKTKKFLAGRTEEELYAYFGMEYVEPELRENTGEIDAAMQKRLPRLVPYNSIKGDLHVHTNWSDGANPTEVMVQKALAVGYEYLAITDHSKTSYYANGLDEKRVRGHFKEMDALQKKYEGKIRILKGGEVDILPNGKLDYDNALLKEFDVVIGSIHSSFKQPKKEMTQRLVKAMENPFLTFIAHPSGRLLNQRVGYEWDAERVLEAARSRNVFLEVNSFPSRLDLDDAHIRMAVENKNLLAINTDAHAEANLDFMQLGVAQARRGWAEEKDVVNAWPLKKVEKCLAR